MRGRSGVAPLGRGPGLRRAAAGRPGPLGRRGPGPARVSMEEPEVRGEDDAGLAMSDFKNAALAMWRSQEGGAAPPEGEGDPAIAAKLKAAEARQALLEEELQSMEALMAEERSQVKEALAKANEAINASIDCVAEDAEACSVDEREISELVGEAKAMFAKIEADSKLGGHFETYAGNGLTLVDRMEAQIKTLQQRVLYTETRAAQAEAQLVEHKLHSRMSRYTLLGRGRPHKNAMPYENPRGEIGPDCLYWPFPGMEDDL